MNSSQICFIIVCKFPTDASPLKIYKAPSVIKAHRGCSKVTSHFGDWWFYTFFVTLRDGKLRGGWYLIQVCDVIVKILLMRSLV